MRSVRWQQALREVKTADNGGIICYGDGRRAGQYDSGTLRV